MGFALGEPILRGLNHLFASFGIDGGEFILLPFCYGMAAVSLLAIRHREQAIRQAIAGHRAARPVALEAP